MMVIGIAITLRIVGWLVFGPAPEGVTIKVMVPKLSSQAASHSVDHAAH
jgi:hypothetical protein